MSLAQCEETPCGYQFVEDVGEVQRNVTAESHIEIFKRYRQHMAASQQLQQRQRRPQLFSHGQAVVVVVEKVVVFLFCFLFFFFFFSIVLFFFRSGNSGLGLEPKTTKTGAELFRDSRRSACSNTGSAHQCKTRRRSERDEGEKDDRRRDKDTWRWREEGGRRRDREDGASNRSEERACERRGTK